MRPHCFCMPPPIRVPIFTATLSFPIFPSHLLTLFLNLLPIQHMIPLTTLQFLSPTLWPISIRGLPLIKQSSATIDRIYPCSMSSSAPWVSAFFFKWLISPILGGDFTVAHVANINLSPCSTNIGWIEYSLADKYNFHIVRKDYKTIFLSMSSHALPSSQLKISVNHCLLPSPIPHHELFHWY